MFLNRIKPVRCRPGQMPHAETLGDIIGNRTPAARHAHRNRAFRKLLIFGERPARHQMAHRARSRRSKRRRKLAFSRGRLEAAERAHAQITARRFLKQPIKPRMHFAGKVMGDVHRDGVDVRQGKAQMRKLFPQSLEQHFPIGSQKIVDAVHVQLHHARRLRQRVKQTRNGVRHLALVIT